MKINECPLCSHKGEDFLGITASATDGYTSLVATLPNGESVGGVSIYACPNCGILFAPGSKGIVASMIESAKKTTKFRQHRNSLTESMSTTIMIEPTVDAILEIAKKELSQYGFNCDQSLIHAEPYGYDNRLDWHTHIVTIDGYGVFGFTNGPIRGTTPNV